MGVSMGMNIQRQSESFSYRTAAYHPTYGFGNVGFPGNKKDRARWSQIPEEHKQTVGEHAENLYDGSRTVARAWSEALDHYDNQHQSKLAKEDPTLIPDNGATILRDEDTGLGYDVIARPSPEHGPMAWDVLKIL